MRLPPRKIYRAFPELDQFSDEECERYVQQVRVQGRMGCWPIVAGGAALALWYLVVIPAFSAIAPRRVFEAASPDASALAALVSLLVLPVLLAGLLALTVRDRLLIRAIRDRVDLARCTSCKHSLLGLPLLGPGLTTEAVRCPECGSVMVLEHLGLTAADLMPRGEATTRPGEV